MLRSVSTNILLLLCASATFLVNAQGDGRPTAKFLNFTHSASTSSADADEVSKLIQQYIVKSGRFVIVGDQADAIDAELDRQKDAIFLDGYMVTQGKALGAKYLIAGHLLHTQAGKPYAAVQLGVIDVATGQTKVLEVLSPQGRTQVTTATAAAETAEILSRDQKSSESKTLRNTAIIGQVVNSVTNKSLEKNVSDFLDEYFPMTFSLTSTEEKGGTITGAILYGYQSYDWRKGESLRVVKRDEIKTPDGKISILETDIARLKIDEIRGDFAHVKVSKKDQSTLGEELKKPDVYIVTSSSAGKVLGR